MIYPRNRKVMFTAVAASIALIASVTAKPTSAQFTLDGTAYYVTGNYTVNTDVSGYDVMLRCGMDARG